MDRALLRKAKVYIKNNRRNSIRRKLVRFLGCVVVFCTTYALILPAITQEKATFCGIKEHIHDINCYIQLEEAQQSVLICTEPEIQYHSHSEECYVIQHGHSHDENCFALQEPELVCGLDEALAHIHSDECYGAGDELLCPITENHSHGESC